MLKAVHYGCFLALLTCVFADLPDEASFTLGFLSSCFDGNPSNSDVRERPIDSSCNRYVARSPGLSGTAGSISLQSLLSPTYYLRHQRDDIKLHNLAPNPSGSEAKDASFYPVESKNHPGWFQFQSENIPSRKIARVNNGLRIVNDNGTPQFEIQSLFKYDPSGTILVLFDDRGTCYDANENHDLFQAKAMVDCMQYRIVPALSGTSDGVSFESRDYSDYFLRHQHSLIKLHRMVNPDPTGGPARDASFIPRESATHPGFYQFVSVNFPQYVIARVGGGRLNIMWDDGTQDLLRNSLFQFSGLETNSMPSSDIQFTLPYNGRSYVLVKHQELWHNIQAFKYCHDNYGYTLTFIESQQHLAALSDALLDIQASTEYHLREVTTAERTSACLDFLDVSIEDLNPSSSHCVVLATYNDVTNDYSGDTLRLIARDCHEKRTILCEAPVLR